MANQDIGNSFRSSEIGMNKAFSRSFFPPFQTNKNPLLAGLWGLFVGPIGIGIYFASWRDFFICTGVALALFEGIADSGEIWGWVFSAIYGCLRSIQSNRKRAEENEATNAGGTPTQP